MRAQAGATREVGAGSAHGRCSLPPAPPWLSRSALGTPNSSALVCTHSHSSALPTTHRHLFKHVTTQLCTRLCTFMHAVANRRAHSYKHTDSLKHRTQMYTATHPRRDIHTSTRPHTFFYIYTHPHGRTPLPVYTCIHAHVHGATCSSPVYYTRPRVFTRPHTLSCICIYTSVRPHALSCRSNAHWGPCVRPSPLYTHAHLRALMHAAPPGAETAFHLNL